MARDRRADPPAPVHGAPGAALGARPRGLRGRRLGARRAPRPARRRTGTWPPTPGPTGSSRLFPGAVYENQFGTVAVRETATSHEITTFRTDHDYADFRRPHHVEFGDDDRARPRAARLHGQRDRLGRGAGAPRRRCAGAAPASTRSAASPTSRARLHPGRRRARARLRGGRAADGPRRPPRRDARLRRSSRRRWRRSGDRAARGARLGRADRRGAREAARGADGRRSGCALMADTGAAGRALTGARGAARRAQNKIEGEDLWDHTLRTVDAAAPTGPVVRAGRAAPRHRQARRPSTTARSAGHEVVGADMAGALLERLHMPTAARSGSSTSSATTCSRYEPNWGDAGRPALHPARSGRRRRRPVRAARGGQRRQRPAAGRRGPGRASARASRPSSRRVRCSTGRRSRSTGAT